jgi:hypothetical protein
VLYSFEMPLKCGDIVGLSPLPSAKISFRICGADFLGRPPARRSVVFVGQRVSVTLPRWPGGARCPLLISWRGPRQCEAAGPGRAIEVSPPF